MIFCLSNRSHYFVDCLKIEDVTYLPPPLTAQKDSPPPHLTNTGHTLTKDTHLSDSFTEQPPTSTVHRKANRTRCPNTIVGVVKVGHNTVSMKIRCKNYLLTLHRMKSRRIKRTAFRLNVVKLRSVGRNPWSLGYVALKYQMNLQPLLKESRAVSPKFYNCTEAPTVDNSSRAGVWPSLMNSLSETKELQKKFCADLITEPKSVLPDDIDNIFSILV